MISVIVPVYKAEPYLEKCVNSILCQTYENLELILVDDGSPDRCPEMCEVLAKKDTRIRVIHKKNGGLSDARNAGLDIATGKYIIFIDSDDYIELGMLEKMRKRLIRDDSDMVFSNVQYVTAQGDVILSRDFGLRDCVLNEEQFWQMYYHGADVPCVISCSKLFKREIFASLRYAMGRIHEDEFIIHQIAAQCRRISCMNEKPYYYVQHQGSITNTAISARNLDVIRAFSDRLQYFAERRYNELVWQTLDCLRLSYYRIGSTLDLSVSANAEAMKNARKIFASAIRTSVSCDIKSHLKQLIMCTLCLSLPAYAAINRLRGKKNP